MLSPDRYASFDAVRFGELLMGAEAFASCARAPKRFLRKIAAQGVEMTVEDLRALERGESVPPDPFVRAVVRVADVDATFFDDAYDDDLRFAKSA